MLAGTRFIRQLSAEAPSHLNTTTRLPKSTVSRTQLRTMQTCTSSGSPAKSYASELICGKAINFHFTRRCNYACKFCFHTAKTSHVLSKEDVRRLLGVMRDAGAAKLNIAGGEPFLHPALLGDMVTHAKQIGFDSVSIISNGSKITREWFASFGRHLDILGISVDSVDPHTLHALGRWPRGARPPAAGESSSDLGQLRHVRRAAQLAREHGVLFKLNTVVTSLNAAEDLTPLVNEVRPMRWKIFQVLPLDGENSGAGGTPGHDVGPLLIDDASFRSYVASASSSVFDPAIIEAEDNATMRSSYLLLDEFGRFLDSSTGGKVPTVPVLDAGLEAAAAQLAAAGGFDADAYVRRGANYADRWSRDRSQAGVHAPGQPPQQQQPQQQQRACVASA